MIKQKPNSKNITSKKKTRVNLSYLTSIYLVIWDCNKKNKILKEGPSKKKDPNSIRKTLKNPELIWINFTYLLFG